MELKYIVMLFGAVMALVGVVLFIQRGAYGSNVVKMFGFEFQLTGSSLVIFVVGSVIFLVPIIYSEKFQITTPQPSRVASPVKPEQPQPISPPPISRDVVNATTNDLAKIRTIVAEYYQVSPNIIDINTPFSMQYVGADWIDEAEIILAVEEQLNVLLYDGDGGIGPRELNLILSPYGRSGGDLSVQLLARMVSDSRN